MDDIQGKVEFTKKLQAQAASQGIDISSEDFSLELQEKLDEYDALDEEQQAVARANTTQMHIQGLLKVPDIDEQNNTENQANARKIEKGTYTPELGNAPMIMRTQAAQREAELRASMGLGPSVPRTTPSLVVPGSTRVGTPKVLLPGMQAGPVKTIVKVSGTRLGKPKVTK